MEKKKEEVTRISEELMIVCFILFFFFHYCVFYCFLFLSVDVVVVNELRSGRRKRL